MSQISSVISVEYALQEAVFAALSQDDDLRARLHGPRIYDRAPEGAAFPYVSLANITSADGSTGTEVGFECRLTLNIWSRHRGKKEVFEIIAHLRRILHDQTLSLAAHHLANLREEFLDISQDRDRRIYRGTMRFRAFIDTLS